MLKTGCNVHFLTQPHMDKILQFSLFVKFININIHFIQLQQKYKMIIFMLHKKER